MEFDYDRVDLEGLERIIVIAGPTGVGKTALSLELAKELDAEIVSVDSLQVYRYLDIGTAKVSPEEREQIPHHLIDVVDPDEDFNAAAFKRHANEAIRDIHSRGKAVLLVGGTGLYVRLLVHGLFDAPPPSEELRAKYARQAEEYGREFLHDRLKEVDPELAAKFHPNDFVRVSRGLEIYDQTGKPLSVHQREHRFSRPNYHALKIALIRPREQLYDRINRRVDQMLELGLEQEYRSLMERGYDRSLKPLTSLGYRQIGEYLFDGLPLAEAVADIKQATRRYAKQQISWFRGEPQTNWALAPVLRDGQVPAEVLGDMEAFLAGEKPGLEWAQIDSYNVTGAESDE